MICLFLLNFWFVLKSGIFGCLFVVIRFWMIFFFWSFLILWISIRFMMSCRFWKKYWLLRSGSCLIWKYICISSCWLVFVCLMLIIMRIFNCGKWWIMCGCCMIKGCIGRCLICWWKLRSVFMSVVLWYW